MKKVLVILSFCSIAIAHAARVNVNEITLKNFKSAFPVAQKVSWKEYETYSEVYFEEGETRFRVDYDLDGGVISSQRCYPEKMLSPFIVSKVKAKYNKTRINTITEMSSAEGIKYYITLEGEKHWYSIACDSYGNISVIDKLNKL